MDIKSLINKVVKKITGNESLLADFKADPVAAVKKIIGDKGLSEDVINSIVTGVTAKLGADKASGLLGKVKSLFKK